MIATRIYQGFWNPQNHPNGETYIAIVEESKKSKIKKKPPCKIMIALQHSLDEAQKRNFEQAINAIKTLISWHKNSCSRCRPIGK